MLKCFFHFIRDTALMVLTEKCNKIAPITQQWQIKFLASKRIFEVHHLRLTDSEYIFKPRLQSNTKNFYGSELHFHCRWHQYSQYKCSILHFYNVQYSTQTTYTTPALKVQFFARYWKARERSPLGHETQLHLFLLLLNVKKTVKKEGIFCFLAKKEASGAGLSLFQCALHARFSWYSSIFLVLCKMQNGTVLLRVGNCKIG